MRQALRDTPIYFIRFLHSNRIGEEVTVREEDDLDIPRRQFVIKSVDKYLEIRAPLTRQSKYLMQPLQEFVCSRCLGDEVVLGKKYTR